MSKNLDHLRQNVIAGFNIVCVGDNRNFSFLPSKNGDTLSKDDLICKRPNTGIDAMDIDKIIGKKINKDLKEDDVILQCYFT